VLVSTTTSGTAKWSDWSSAGFLKTDKSGNISIDTKTYLTSVPNDHVTNVRLANMAINTIKGRASVGTGDPEDLTPAQVRTMLNVADGANNYTHPTTARTNTTGTAAPGFGGTFNVVDTITSNGDGHITGVKTTTITIPTPNYPATNISTTHNATTVVVNSSTGNNDTINGATASLAGVVTNAAQTFGGLKTFNNNIALGAGSPTWTIDDTTDTGNLTFKKDLDYMTIKSDGVYFNDVKLGSGAVTSVTGTSPVVVTSGTTPAISLASGYGDTLNPYTSKASKLFLATPNASTGVPSFRAIAPSDIPALNYITKTASRNPGHIPTWGNADGGSLGDGYSVETTLTGGTGAIPRADAVKTYVDGILAANDAMVFKGTIGSGGTYEITAFNNLTTYNVGWTYKVITAGSIKGKIAEVGDLVMATVDRTGASADYSD
jgi:hypothetical protein